MVHWYVQDHGHGLIIHVNFIVKYVYYMESLDPMVVSWIGATLMGGHYDGHHYSMRARSNLVTPLVLCTIVYNCQGTNIVLQVHQDNTNLLRRSNISGRPYY
jgi:hypothetical protein